MLVMKFGGSSVKDAAMFKQVAEIVAEQAKTEKPVVVLSAVKGTTDLLLNSIEEACNSTFDSYSKITTMHGEILADLDLPQTLLDTELDELREALEVISRTKEKNKQMTDYVSFFGERMSTIILAQLLKTKAYISGDIGVLTDSQFGDARLLPEAYEEIKKHLTSLDHIPIITGFGGKDKKGEFTTFSRGGSDYVGALIGSAIDATEIQIWTDVNGFLTSDPRVIENTKTIEIMSFDEASQLSYFGAKVLHPKTIWPAIKKDIPVVVKNTFNPTHKGTTIVPSAEKKHITAVSYKKGIIAINVRSLRMLDGYGYLARIFNVFQEFHKPVDMIATSEVDVSLTIDNDEKLDEITSALNEIARISVYRPKAIISVVGEGLKKNPELTGEIITHLTKSGIQVEMISQCHNQVSVCLLVPENLVENAVKVIHCDFFDTKY
ncbi:MAG: aspartate kinase [Candidatus Woesearchaeota archaeon]